MENRETEMSMELLAKQLRMTRVFCMISSMLTLCLLLGGVFLFSKLQPVFDFLQEIEPAMEQLSALDIESVNTTLEQINATLGSVDWQQVSDSLGQLDVEAINTAIEGLDTEALSEAIENLNKTADTLEGWGEKLSSFSNLFGN